MKEAGTKEKTPPGTSEFEAYQDETAEPLALVVQVGATQLRYHLRCITDLHALLKAMATGCRWEARMNRSLRLKGG